MQKIWLVKAVVVAMILVGLKMALFSIDGVVEERAARQQDVEREIASSNYGAQVYSGPVLILPYVEEWEYVNPEKQVEKMQREHTLRIFPKTSVLEGSVQVSTKSRGLFKARIFDWTAQAHGNFHLGELKIERDRADSRIKWGQPVLSLPVTDPRGLIGTPTLQWNGQDLAFDKGSGHIQLGSGLHAKLPQFDPLKAQQFDYSLGIALRGTQSVAVIPLADDNKVKITSPWPHPSFGGQFLPNADTQEVSASGFSAQWNISALASSAQQQVTATSLKDAERIEVRFIEPIDIYSLSDRALKYSFLFILLTFCCFLLFEVLKRLPIHPAQYLMVGLALATFFLLLVALSEHFAFVLAYIGASFACIALLTVYLSAVLRSKLRGTAFAGLLTALYGALYGLLISEDNALLLGALLVFGLLALAMISTRKVDWYALGQRNGTDLI